MYTIYANSTKGNNFCDFNFAFLDGIKPFKIGVSLDGNPMNTQRRYNVCPVLSKRLGHLDNDR